MIADNQLALNSDWDEELLRIELALLQESDYDLNVVGFEDEELARLLAQQDAAEGLTDEDAVPELPETPTSVTGDIWILDEHRVACGHSTLRGGVELLMDGDAADLVFTDPPYNCDYQGYTKDQLKIRNDKMTSEQFRQFLQATFASYRHCEAGRLDIPVPCIFMATRVPERDGGSRLRSPVSNRMGEKYVRLGLRAI